MSGVDQGAAAQGPLVGLRVVEFAAIGPVPYATMLLADLGAEVIRIDRPGGNGWDNPVVDRGRASLTLDIRNEEGRERAIEIAALADVLVEGLRPGVMERLGLGPEILCAANPRLIYGRMTGWGQDGPLARTAGHDLNYIALTGALAAIGKPGEPATVPMNLVGDFGGGSLFLVFGILAALYERQTSGRGQVIDAAIVDGTSSMMASIAGMLPSGAMSVDRDKNELGGAAPFYRCYLCADGREISVGALEERFYFDLLDRLGAPAALREAQYDRSNWSERAEIFANIFRSRTQAEWCELLEGTDACFAPVLRLEEAYAHPQLSARSSYLAGDQGTQVAPAPRFSRTPGRPQLAASPERRIDEWKKAAAQ